MLTGGIIEHLANRIRHCVARRVPFALPDLLAEAEPEHVLPAPVVDAFFPARQRRIRRRVQNVLGTELRRAIDEPFVFGAAVRRRHVDLVVVDAPADKQFQRTRWQVEQKRADAVAECFDFGFVGSGVGAAHS